jgi:hypothetical protein
VVALADIVPVPKDYEELPDPYDNGRLPPEGQPLSWMNRQGLWALASGTSPRHQNVFGILAQLSMFKFEPPGSGPESKKPVRCPLCGILMGWGYESYSVPAGHCHRCEVEVHARLDRLDGRGILSNCQNKKEKGL